MISLRMSFIFLVLISYFSNPDFILLYNKTFNQGNLIVVIHFFYVYIIHNSLAHISKLLNIILYTHIETCTEVIYDTRVSSKILEYFCNISKGETGLQSKTFSLFLFDNKLYQTYYVTQVKLGISTVIIDLGSLSLSTLSVMFLIKFFLLVIRKTKY